MENKSSPIIIRQLSIAESKKILPCLKELRAHLATINPQRKQDISPDFFEYWINKMNQEIQNQSGNVYVAADGTEIVGYAYGTILNPSIEDRYEFLPEKIGEIIDLYVKPEYQQLGLGSQLIAKLSNFFAIHKCNRISLAVLNTNTNSIKRYKQMGFEIKTLEMTKKILK